MSEHEFVRRGAKSYLRRVCSEDADHFFRWYCDGRIQKHLANPWWNPRIDFDAYRLFRFSLYLEPSETSGVLTICAMAGDPIGLVNYFDIDDRNKVCEVGIIIGEVQLWRRGYALEALRLLIDFLAREHGIVSIQARILEENVASQKLFTKAGFAQTGTSREQDFIFLDYQYSVMLRNQ